MIDIPNSNTKTVFASHLKNTADGYLGFQDTLNSAKLNNNSALNPNQSFSERYFQPSFYSDFKTSSDSTTAPKEISLGDIGKSMALPRYTFPSFAYTTNTHRLVFTPLMSVEKILDFYENSTLDNAVDIGKYIKWYSSARHIASGKGMAVSLGGLNGFAPEVGVLDSTIPKAIQSQLMDRLGNAAEKIGLPQNFVNKLSGKDAKIRFTASTRTTVEEPHRQMYYLRIYMVTKKGSQESRNLTKLSSVLANELFKNNPIKMIELTQGEKEAALIKASSKLEKFGRATPSGVVAHEVIETAKSKSIKNFLKKIEISVGVTYAPIVIEGGLENPHLTALQIPSEAFEQIAQKLYDTMELTGSDKTSKNLEKINPAINSSLLEEVIKLPNAMYDDTLIQVTRFGDMIKETFTSEETKKEQELEFKNNPIPQSPESIKTPQEENAPPQATNTKRTLSNITYYSGDTYMSIMGGTADMSKPIIDYLYKKADKLGDVIKETMLSDKAEARIKEDNKNYIKREGGVPDAPTIHIPKPEPKKYQDMTGFYLKPATPPKDIDSANIKTDWKLNLAQEKLNTLDYISNISLEKSDDNIITTHKVKSGDTLGKIAEKYNGFSTLDNILEANPQITDPDKIKVGDIINIPNNTQNNLDINLSKQTNTTSTYIVKTGDTLGEIAEKHGGFSTLNHILKVNPQITAPDKIKTGDIIYLPN